MLKEQTKTQKQLTWNPTFSLFFYGQEKHLSISKQLYHLGTMFVFFLRELQQNKPFCTSKVLFAPLCTQKISAPKHPRIANQHPPFFPIKNTGHPCFLRFWKRRPLQSSSARYQSRPTTNKRSKPWPSSTERDEHRLFWPNWYLHPWKFTWNFQVHEGWVKTMIFRISIGWYLCSSTVSSQMGWFEYPQQRRHHSFLILHHQPLGRTNYSRCISHTSSAAIFEVV